MEKEDKTKEELVGELNILRKKAEEYEVIKKRSEDERVELVKTNRALRTLSDCNQVLVRAKEEFKFMQDVCNILTSTGGYKLAWVGYAEFDEKKSVRPVAYAGFEEGYLESADITWEDAPRGRGPVGTSIRNRQIQIVQDVTVSESFSPWRENALSRGYNSVIALPLIFNEICYGSLAIYSPGKNYFDKYEVNLLEELAQDLAYGITTLRNETERKNFESRLRISEENYRKLVEISPNPISVHSEGKFVYVNKAGLNLIGADKPEDLIGRSVFDILHPDYKEKVIERISSMQNGLDVQAMEEKFIRLDGKIIDVMVAASRMTYKGKPAIQVVINDISKLKRIEMDLREKEERFRGIFENAPIGMYRTTPAGDILLANKALYEMLGYSSAGEFMAHKMREIYVDPKERDRLLNILRSEGETIGFETVFRKKDGTLINVRFNTKYLKNSENGEYFLEGTVEDVTTQMKIKEELVKAKEHAEEMSKLKSNFLANMSHELRTPLVAILGFADIFQTELDDDVYKEMADSIYASGQRLLETLNSILDLSRLESNKLDISNEEFNVSEIIKDITDSFMSFAENKGLYIKAVIKDENARALLDKQMVYKIINHLINNAVKYTVQGGITVELDTYLQDNNKLLQVIVRDTGIGIPKESINLIFEEFRQVSEGLNRNFEGSGLGLTITKKFVEMMNGSISVSSTEGKGTEFTVLLPATYITEKSREEAAQPAFSDTVPADQKENLPRILLVENDLPTVDVTRIILRKLYRIEVESTGVNAVTAASRTKYDAILMDINLGAGMDGTNAMEKIKEIPLNADTPVIAFTAYAMSGDKEKFLKLGFSDYIAKPFEKKTLIDLLEKVFPDDAKS